MFSDCAMNSAARLKTESLYARLSPDPIQYDSNRQSLLKMSNDLHLNNVTSDHLNKELMMAARRLGRNNIPLFRFKMLRKTITTRLPTQHSTNSLAARFLR